MASEMLYELVGEYLRCYEMADDPDMDEDSWFGMMEAIDEDLEIKAEHTVQFVKNLGADAAEIHARAKAFRDEADRIEAIANSKDHLANRLIKGIEKMMIATGKTNFKTDNFSFRVQKNSPALKVNEDIDVWKVPEEFLVYHDPTIDKAKVKEAIKAGQEFDWAHMEQSESLRIR